LVPTHAARPIRRSLVPNPQQPLDETSDRRAEAPRSDGLTVISVCDARGTRIPPSDRRIRLLRGPV
jgi:hypothetical protein